MDTSGKKYILGLFFGMVTPQGPILAKAIYIYICIYIYIYGSFSFVASSKLDPSPPNEIGPKSAQKIYQKYISKYIQDISKIYFGYI